MANISESPANSGSAGQRAAKSPCPKGYAMDLVTEMCVDVDECETGDADCNVDTQICRNEVGSYKCVDVIPPSAEDCKPGFRFNVGTEACEGLFLARCLSISPHRN